MSTSAPVPTAEGLPYSPGWYVVKVSNGAVGIVKHAGSGEIHLGSAGYAIDATLLSSNTSQDFPTMIASLGAKLNSDLSTIGANAKQSAAVLQVIDLGAGKNANVHQFLISPDGTQVQATDAAGNPISDKSSGDATAGGINLPSSITDPLSAIGDSLSWLTTPSSWLRILEFVGGAALILFAMKTLAGGS